MNAKTSHVPNDLLILQPIVWSEGGLIPLHHYCHVLLILIMEALSAKDFSFFRDFVLSG